MPNMCVPDSHLPRIVVIGAGFAGVKFVQTIDPDAYQVVMLDKNNYHTFQPLLYQVATAGLEPDAISYGVRALFSSRENFFFRVCEVDRVDTDKQIVYADTGEIHYDYLVIGTGSYTNFGKNESVYANAMSMKNVTEALDIRHLALQNFEKALLTTDLAERDKLMTFVIAGGGATGVELAGAFAELKNHVLPNDYPDLDVRRMSIYLIQGGKKLLPGFTEKAQDAAQAKLESTGVKVLTETRVRNYDGEKVITDKREIPTQCLIWAAGVKGVVLNGFPEESIKWSRFVVDTLHRVKGVDNVFACGDCALMECEAYPEGHPMVAQPALQQGRNLALNFNRKLRKKEPREFDYFDKGSMATIGRDMAVVNVRGMTFTGFIAWVLWLVVHILFLMGWRNKIITLFHWIVDYFKYNKGVRLIIRPYKKHIRLPEKPVVFAPAKAKPDEKQEA